MDFPWPPKELSPNSRKKHLHIKDIRKNFKASWWNVAKANKMTHLSNHLSLTFCPPSNHRHDLDNMYAACKYGIDGFALAIGVDDSVFDAATIRKGPKVKGGAVIVEFIAEATIPTIEGTIS
jgi:crossover junction endodeoxyribonuclease RusA